MHFWTENWKKRQSRFSSQIKFWQRHDPKHVALQADGLCLVLPFSFSHLRTHPHAKSPPWLLSQLSPAHLLLRLGIQMLTAPDFPPTLVTMPFCFCSCGSQRTVLSQNLLQIRQGPIYWRKEIAWESGARPLAFRPMIEFLTWANGSSWICFF